MSDTATDNAEAPAEETEPVEVDEVRDAVVATLSEHLGDALIASHVQPGRDIYVRVDRDAWVRTHETAVRSMGFRLFDFLSAIDWLPSPFGRDMESEQDWIVYGRDEKEAPPMESGLCGGDTRFQVLSRVFNIETNIGINIKADLPDDDISVDTIIPVFPGANWHEREAWEMFGINFAGHPDLRALYLPSGFEGNPMRKDYPLLARRVKPWPGIVDVEGMPGSDDDEADGEGADA